MLKAAPRYYEFSFLLLALFFALIWERVKYVKLYFVLFVIVQCAGLYLNYFSSPILERESRFLFWKDSSRDFLAKQELTRFFGLNDCHISDIASGDARVVDTFKFLQHGDWLITNSDAKCKWGKVRVEREEFRLNNNEFLKKYEFLLWQENK